MRIAGAGQDRVRGAGADGGEGAFDFRRGQLQLGADVGRNRKQRLLRGARAGLNGLAGVDHEVGERAFRILDVGPDPERQFLGACHQAIAGLPPAALDAARHGFDARTQEVFELRDAHIDVGGDRADPGFDALVDFLEPRRDGVGQLGAAAIDGLGHAGDAPVDRFDRLGGAVGERRGEVGEALIDRLDRLRGAVGQRRCQRAQPAVDGLGHRFRPRIEVLFERLETAVDGLVEGFDLAFERGLELHEALVQRSGDLAAVRGQAGVEGVDIGLQGFRDILGALTHAIDDLAAEGFDGAVEFRDVAGNERTERAAVAREFFREFAALVLHQFIERAHLQGERVVRGLGLADDLRHQRVHGHVERFAGLVAGGEDLGREPVAGVVDLADQIAAAQFELQQQRVAGILQRVVNLFGALGNAVDDGGGALLEFAGDAVDPLVQHLVDALGQIDEFVMDVAGLEIEAGGEAFAGVEHRARGLGAGFLETIEQVAAALAEREDHVVAGVAERTGDVGAAFFQRAGDALGNLIDARGDGVRDQRDIVAQVDLHAGDGAANLLGLADQIVALMGDVLQQRADAHLVVAVGALERRDFVGDQGFEFAGARDGAFDAVAHRRDFAADRLTDGHHRVAGGALGLRKADRNLRHRLRDHAQFLAAPGKAREEIEQQYRREEQCRQTRQHQGAAAALADGRLQRGEEAEGQKRGAENPDAGKQRGERIDVAGGAALLNGLQNLPDGFAVVIGGAAGRARLLDRFKDLPVGARAGVESALVVSRRRR